MNWRIAELGWRVAPGAIATVLFAGLLKLGALQPLEDAAYQGLFRLRGEQAWDDRIVLVKIDDPSLKKLGRFPWSRQRYAELLKKLTAANATLLVTDVLLSESSPEDGQLAKVMEASIPMILAQGEDRSGLPLLPVPSLRDRAIDAGHIRAIADADGIVRKIEPEVRQTLALGVVAVNAYSFLREEIPKPDLSEPIWLNWAGGVENLRQVSFADAISGKVDSTIFKNKIVLVGLTATATDAAPTPFDQNPPANGVHLQATLIHNLLRQNALKPVNQTGAIALILMVGGLGFGVFLSAWRTSFQIAIAASLILGWVLLSVFLLNVGYLIPVALPISLLLTTGIITVLTERWRINLVLQQKLQQLWQQYQPDLVMHPVKESDVSGLPKVASMESIARLTALADQFGRSQSTQAAIARSLSIGLIASDFEGFVWFCNPIASKLLHVEVGSLLDAALIPAWLTSDEWQRALTALKQNQSPESKERPLQNEYEVTQWFCLRFEALNSETHAQANGFLVLLEDITAQKAIETNLDQQIAELQRMSQLKDDFLSTISHELRTPLTNMRMAIQLIKMVSNEKQKSHYLQILENECSRETELINDLLDLQRLEAGKQLVQAELIDFYTWLPEITEPFYQRAEFRQQTIHVQVDPSLPCCKSDRASIERLMSELLNNACKYTPPNHEIVVTADWVNPFIELSVSNSGVEIPQKERSRIFERFYRVPQSDRWKQGGTGLGLALVKRLVETLNGEISVQSEDGWTTFTARLPLDLDRSLRLR